MDHQSCDQGNYPADDQSLSIEWLKKIDVTDVISLSNQDFLSALFGDVDQHAQPIIVSFQESPARVDKRAWTGVGRKSADATNYVFDDGNNFFSVATFYADANGFYARRKKRFCDLRAFMLDDVGTKVALERLAIEPTALIETSRGNYQAIYALAEPLQDAVLADQLMKAFIAAALCDPGADGPTARLARLPVGINRKYEPPHKCSLHYWVDHKKYTIEELIAGFGLEEFLNTPKASKKKARPPRAASTEPVYVPTEEENSVIAALKAQKLFKMPLGSGKSDITCPWVHEHTDGIDHGTAYFEPDVAHPIGGFSCLHAHCKERTIKDLLDYLKVSPSHARGKAQINVDPGEMGNIIDAAERELAKSGKHYQRGGMICIVSTAPETNHTSITPIKTSNIRIALSDAASWYKYYPGLEDYVQIDPPAEYAKALFDAPEYRYLPVLRGLARQPYLRSDGSLTTTPGYDPLTGMFGVFASQEFNIPDAPTISDVQASIKLIESLLEECSFKSAVDHAATLSAILTAAIRCSLPLAPMFHVRAPLVGSGKSFLCRIIGIFSSARLGTPTTFPQEDEECRKLLLAELLTGPAVIEFDNLTTDLVAHKSLCVALTSEYMTDRVLGVSKTASVSTRTLFLSSGNNVSPTQDMVRRCITIDLDPLCETPATKNYKNPRLIEDILAARGRYVSAALTIIRGWIVAGKPRTECKTLATFTDWVDLCTQPLMWLPS